MISTKRNLLVFALAFVLTLLSGAVVAAQAPSGAPKLPKGARLMTPDELQQQLNNVGIKSVAATANVADSQMAQFSNDPVSANALITFVPEGSAISGGFSLTASNGMTLQPGSFVFASITNPGQPSLFQWGVYFPYSVPVGGLWYPLENERKERYTEIAGMASYAVSVYQPGSGIQTFTFARTVKKYESGLPTQHFIVDGYDAGNNALVLLGNFAPGAPAVTLKDSESYSNYRVDPTAVQNFGSALVINVDRDPNIGSLPPADYVAAVTTVDGKADHFTLRVGARNLLATGVPPPTAPSNPVAPTMAKSTGNKATPAASAVPQPMALMIVNLPSRDVPDDTDKDKDKDQAKKDDNSEKVKDNKAAPAIPSRPLSQ